MLRKRTTKRKQWPVTLNGCLIRLISINNNIIASEQSNAPNKWTGIHKVKNCENGPSEILQRQQATVMIYELQRRGHIHTAGMEDSTKIVTFAWCAGCVTPRSFSG